MARQKFPCVIENVLIITSNTTGLSFELKRIGLFAAIIVALFYLLVLHSLFKLKIQKHFSFSACSETLLKSTCQHLLLLVGFDTLTYRKDYDRSPILVGHQNGLNLLVRQHTRALAMDTIVPDHLRLNFHVSMVKIRSGGSQCVRNIMLCMMWTTIHGLALQLCTLLAMHHSGYKLMKLNMK